MWPCFIFEGPYLKDTYITDHYSSIMLQERSVPTVYKKNSRSLCALKFCVSSLFEVITSSVFNHHAADRVIFWVLKE